MTSTTRTHYIEAEFPRDANEARAINQWHRSQMSFALFFHGVAAYTVFMGMDSVAMTAAYRKAQEVRNA